jgi:hypothetical protein
MATTLPPPVVSSLTWQPPAVHLVHWTGNRAAVEAAVAGTPIKVMFADGWCVAMCPTGGKPSVNMAPQGSFLCLHDGSFLTRAQVIERYPGLL